MLGLGLVSANCVVWGQNRCSGGSVAVGTGLLAPHCVLARTLLCGLWSPQGPQACLPHTVWVVVTTRTPGWLALDCGHPKDPRLARPGLWSPQGPHTPHCVGCGHHIQGPQACSPLTAQVVVTTSLLTPHSAGCGHHKDLWRLETSWR